LLFVVRSLLPMSGPMHIPVLPHDDHHERYRDHGAARTAAADLGAARGVPVV
jgi:hypothetical protein